MLGTIFHKKQDLGVFFKILAIWILLNAFLLFAAFIVGYFDGTIRALMDLNLESLDISIIQGAQFGAVFGLALFITRKKQLSLYLFTVIQFILLHIIFFANLNPWGGELQFFNDYNDFDVRYILNYSSSLVDYLVPINAMYDGIGFVSFNLKQFYLVRVLSPIINYFVISWLALKLADYLKLKGFSN